MKLTLSYQRKADDNRMLRRILGSKKEELTGDWRELHTRSFIIRTKIYQGDQISETGRACWMHRGVEKCTQSFGRKT
jgi:hypothetical protein